ncbi:MAG TPA: acyltransferase [Thermoanaerobaculia bacterium]|nr:acyltransferase [Thermoanaerobaculia bacterium]
MIALSNSSGETPGRIPELDGIRGLAILLVIAWHYVAAPLLGVPTPLAQLAWRSLRLAWSGVDLFFVLSGFLIGGILLDRRAAPRYFRAFYARRFCRILPLYFLFLGSFFLLLATAPVFTASPAVGPLFSNPLPAWSYVTFTQNWVMVREHNFGPMGLGITWSLAIEEQFYLVLPLMVRFIPARWLPASLAAVSLVALVWRVLAGPSGYFAALVLTPCRADSLMLGVLCAWALRQERWRRLIRGSRRALYGILVVFLPVLAGLCLFRHYGFEGSPYLFSILAVLYGSALLLAVTEGHGPVTWLFRRRWLRALGGRAYCVYLIHQTINGLAHALILGHPPGFSTPGEIATTAAAGAVTLALAEVSWRLFEKPLIAWGHSVSYG